MRNTTSSPRRHFVKNKRWPAPADLPPEAARLWDEIVAEVPDDQLRAGDVPLLSTYCRTALLAQEAAEHLRAEGQIVDGKATPWAKLLNDHSKVLVALAAKLRLCPSSRIRPEAAELARTPAGRKPWEFTGDE